MMPQQRIMLEIEHGDFLLTVSDAGYRLWRADSDNVASLRVIGISDLFDRLNEQAEQHELRNAIRDVQ